MRPFFLLAFLIAPTGAIADTGSVLGLQTMCPSIYQPVCGSKSGGSQTFANACLATRAGFIVASQGMCGGGNAGLPRFCTKEYLPVCGERGGKRRVSATLAKRAPRITSSSTKAPADHSGCPLQAEGEYGIRCR